MDYDLAVIGAGWAGFNCALKAKAHGLKVALIDKSQIGGTCLNRGCIPTKSLLYSAKIYTLAKKSGTFGIETSGTQINFPEIQSRKNKILQQLRQGMEFMLKGIDFVNAQARILSANALRAGEKEINAKSILIATGSSPIELSGIRFDGEKVISSDEALELKEVPKSLLIIGGGVIGCEFAGLFSAFGCQVTIIELTPQLLPGADKDIARKLETAFKKKGVRVLTGTDAKSADFSQYNLALLCVGRRAVTQGLGLDEAGIKTDKGRVVVDEYLRTSIPNIYAAGDCASNIMLAHLAAHQGCVAAENIIAGAASVKAMGSNIPGCIFTDPEIGSVGLSEEEARSNNAGIKVHKFDFLGSGMARILEEADGFIKVISEAKTGRILGASIIGPRATELIGILTIAVQSGLNVKNLQGAILAHPTLSESITDALKDDHGL